MEGAVSSWRRFGTRKRELDEEIASHLRMAIADRVARGATEEEARAAAECEMGNLPLAKDVTREMWGWVWLERLGQDVRYALRQMRRSPGFAATAVGTLALGIGAAAAMFTVVDHVLLSPVPYKDAGRVVTIGEGDGNTEGAWYGAPWLDIEEWRNQSRSFEEIAFSGGVDGRSYLEGKAGALEVSGVTVSSNLFQTLGVNPALGRGFSAETPGFVPANSAGTIVLSDAVWKAAFGADRGIVGRVVKINQKPYTVVGVMPAAFRYPAGIWADGQVWVPVELGAGDKGRGWDSNRWNVVARLRRGVSLKAASAEMAVIQKRVAREYANADERNSNGHVLVRRYGATLVDTDVRRALLALLGAAGLLWLIATVNVTNLLLARSMARQREIAMRGALGASRWRIVQQMTVEGLLLSGVAGLVGIGLAVSSVKILARELAQRLPLPAPAMPDGWILAALLGLTVVSALLSTAWPAWLAVRAPIEPGLKQGGQQTGAGRRHNRLRGALVAAEIAMSLTLLVGCGLLLRTIYILRHVPLGYRTDHILVAHLSIPSYRFTNRNMTAELYEPMLERARHLHGVQAAGLMSEVPLGGTYSLQITLYLEQHQKALSWFKAVTPDVQRVFGFRMAAGRFFNASDTSTSQPVVVVNQAFAREYSPNEHEPAAILGRKLMSTERGEKKTAPAVIVGVLDDTHQFSVSLPSQPEMELCLPQIMPNHLFYETLDGVAMDLAVRTDQPTAEMIPELRDILRQANPELANSTITTMDQIVEDSYGSQRLAAHLLEIFGGSALLLCVAGLYGLLAYVVTQRTRELGVRIALGAQRADLLWMVMRQAGAMLLVGVLAGVGLALASGRLVTGFLYGVKAHDGWTLAGAAVLLFLSGMLAAYLPARRAAGVNPMEALRSE
jgi:predicted permease